MHSHLTGNMGQDFMAVFQFDSKGGVRKCFADNTINFYRLLFGRTNLSELFQLSARCKYLSFSILHDNRMFKMCRRPLVA